MKLENRERLKTVKVSGEKCKISNSIFPKCYCDDCYHNIIEYLGKKKGKKYKYTGTFAAGYLNNREVIIESFFVDEDEETNSCEAFIKLSGGQGGQCAWIPRKEIINNLINIKGKNK